MKRLLFCPLFLLITITLCSHICGALSWGSSYFSDKEMINLGYAVPGAENVGALHGVYKYPYCQDTRMYKYASVVYIGGLTCLTAAHCLRDEASCFDSVDFYQYFKIADKVSFEIKGMRTYFNVKHAVVHPDYDGTPLRDIAILCLDRVPEGLMGLDPDYSLGRKDVGGNRQDVLTYVGYGHGGNDSGCFGWVDDKRRACQSSLFKVQGTYILSLPYHSDIKCVSEEEYMLIPRQAFKFESIARPAMSGGATLLNNAFVGVNMGCSYTLLPFGKKVLFDFWYYMSSFINLFVITDLPMLHTRYPFVGVISGSVALGPHEQWIRDCKSAFDKDCSIDSRV